MKKLLLFLGFLAAVSTINFSHGSTVEAEKTQTTKEQSFNLKRTVLSNGMEIIAIKLNSNGTVRMGVLYHVGCADDPNCKVGQSHFLEHMMFKGTKTISGPQLKYLIDKYNSYTNAITGKDFTCYFHVLKKEFLEFDMKLEADRMVDLKLDDKDVISEQNVVAEERNYRCDSDPAVRHYYDAINRLLFLHSSYGFTGIGYPHHIKAYNKSALQKHYNKFYAPNNASLIVVGDIDPQKVFEMAERTFGQIKKTHEINRERVIDPEDLNIAYTADRISDQISKKDITIAFKVPRRNLDTLKKYYTAKIAVDCLFGNSSSLMAKELVEDKNILYRVGGEVMMNAFDKGYVFISADVPQENTIKSADEQITACLNKIMRKDQISTILSKEVFETTKKKIQDGLLMMLDNPGTMFNYICDGLSIGFPPKEMSDIQNIVSQITWNDVKIWILYNLAPSNRTVTFYNHPKGIL